MKKFITNNTIKVNTKEINRIKQYCADNQYDPYNLFIYYKDGIHIGFSDDDSEHIKLDEKHWMPVHHT